MNKKVLNLLIIFAIALSPILVKAEGITWYEETVVPLPELVENVSIDAQSSKYTDFTFPTVMSGYHKQSLFTTDFSVNGNCFKSKGAYCITPYQTNKPSGKYICYLLDKSDSYNKVVANIMHNANAIVINGEDVTDIVKAVALRMWRAYNNLENCDRATCKTVMNGYKAYYDYKEGNPSNPGNYFGEGWKNSQYLEKAYSLIKTVSTNSYTTTPYGAYECYPTTGRTNQAQYFYIKAGAVDCKKGECNPTSSETVQPFIDGIYNNCCEDNQNSEIYEHKIDELFVDYECLGVEKFSVKNNSSGFIDSSANGSYSQGKLDSEFCELYCTERAIIKQPGTSTVVKGSYFKLNTLEYKGKTYQSPILDAYKACRVRIKYYDWIKAFSGAIEDTGDAYNDYQKVRAEQEFFEQAVSTTNKTEKTIKLSGSCTRGEASSCPDYSCLSTDTGAVAQYGPCDTGYTENGTKCEKEVTTIDKKNCSDGPSCKKCPDGYDKRSDGNSYYCGKDIKTTKKIDRPITYKCSDDTKPTDYGSSSGSIDTISFTGIFYYFPETEYKFHTVNVTIGGNYEQVPLFNSISIAAGADGTGNHSRYSIIAKTGDSIDTRIKSRDNSLNSLKSDMEGKQTCAHTSSSSVSYAVTCTSSNGILDDTTYAGWTDENVDNTYGTYTSANGKVYTASASYATAANTIKELEKKLYVCDNYFSQFAGSNKNNYKLEPNLKFEYSQIYLDDFGKKAEDRLKIGFERVCEGSKVQVPNPSIYSDQSRIETLSDNIDELTAVRYSTAYGSSKVNYNIFKCTLTNDDTIKSSNAGSEGGTNYSSPTGDNACTAANAKEFLNSIYSKTNTNAYEDALAPVQVTPAFEYDGRYNTICYWKPTDKKTKYTFPGSGITVENKQIIEYYNGVNKRLLTIRHTTLDGKYQIYMDLTGIGTNGKFDEFVRTEGTTCAGKSSSVGDKWAPFTCTYHSFSHIESPGYCIDEDMDGNPVIDDPNDPRCVVDPKLYYSFKVIDTDNVFPNCSSTQTDVDKEQCYESLKYGYNWLVEDEGKKVLDDIQSENTYDRINLTYSFTLNSETMKAIKKYNIDRQASGGYEDFNLACQVNCKRDLDSISEMRETEITINGVTTKAYIYDDACSKCYSNFISDLSKNRVGSTTINSNPWRKDKTLEEVRLGLDW